MTIIEYKAINASNKIMTGSVPEDHFNQLESKLLDQGLRLISYRYIQRKKYKTLSYTHQQALWMSLRYYMMSGFTLVDAIKHMVQSSVDEKLQGVLHAVYQCLQQGQQFSLIMKSYIDKTDVLTISLLESAEQTGDYLEVLSDLEEYAAWQVDFKGNVQQSLRYPSIVFGAIWISIFCILYFFAPQLSSYLQNTNYTIPTITSVLIGLSQFVVHWPVIWISLPFVVGIGFKTVYRRFPNLRSVGVYIPGIRSLIFGYYYASISKVLYLQLKHGHSLVNSLKNIQEAYATDWIAPVLKKIVSKVEQGVSLTTMLKHYGWLFSKFFIQLVEVGEQTNMLGDNLKVISAYYERDTKQKIAGYIKLIEPLMLVFMGLILIVVVGGLFYPMYEQIGMANHG
ncbi:type II secretion system F family protein [Candidatus Bodocaedibacter vickermanii]|uniref:Type II secretion system protein F n=1 Tax=Candidatus Bodocaedibacter vickermanii TaxID=2741701 RepID=A0A7L9RTV3_9PROT|nr:Putative type II secretion system protein F [Candidatus Paracaedibacteraceae bacterium 'Lake Konstanz']